MSPIEQKRLYDLQHDSRLNHLLFDKIWPMIFEDKIFPKRSEIKHMDCIDLSGLSVEDKYSLMDEIHECDSDFHNCAKNYFLPIKKGLIHQSDKEADLLFSTEWTWD